MPVYPHWQIGGSFLIFFRGGAGRVLGFIFMRVTAPAFFKKQTLTRAYPDPGPRRVADPAAARPGCGIGPG